MADAQETTTMEVIVHKQNVPMMKGESINMFTNKLSQAGRAHVLRKLNITEKDGGAWLVEAFQDRAVFSTYKGQEPTKHFAFKYTRNKSGDFEFGGVIEVERVTSFKPKSDMSVTKGVDVEKAVWTAAAINDLPDSSFAVILPGGKKDKDGKTVPRSLRKLPFKDANGKVDLPHLRNALARLSQSDLPASAMAEAKRKLEAAAKTNLPSSAAAQKPKKAAEKAGGDKVKKGIEEFEVNKSAPEEFEGWKQTTKSFWMGVL